MSSLAAQSYSTLLDDIIAGTKIAIPPTSGVTAGSYTNANITVAADGRVTAAANGSSGSGGNFLNLITDEGAVGNGTTNDAAAFTALNTAGRIGYLPKPATSYRIATAITISTPLIFELGARIKVDGVNVNITYKPIAPLTQIFEYVNGGTVTFPTFPECPAEWWGAVADNSTDCYNGIMAALGATRRVVLGSGTYYTSNTIKIASYQSLEGAGWRNTLITSNSATLHVVMLTPLSGFTAGTQATYVASPRVANLGVGRSVTPTSPVTPFDTSGATGVRVLGCNGFTIENVIATDHNIGFYFGATNGGFVKNVYSERTRGSTTDSYIGFYIDGLSTTGTTGSPNSSLRILDPVMSNSISGNKAAYGFYINGHFADVWLFRPESANAYRGIAVVGVGGTTDPYCTDLHIIQPVNDLFYTNGIFMNAMTPYAQVHVDGGNCAPNASANSGAAGLYIQSCNDAGIVVDGGHQVFGTNFSGCTGALLNTCSGITVDLNIKDCSIPVQIWGMQASQVTGIIRNNSISATDGIAMDAATGPIVTRRNRFSMTMRGSITNGYKMNQSIGACTNNEYDCTMIDSASVTNKLNDNGTMRTTAGIFGTNGNLASGVMN